MNQTGAEAMPQVGSPFTDDCDYEWTPMILALGMAPLTGTQLKRRLIAVEGGGTRGFASLSMLRVLMDQIREIETAENPHTRLVRYTEDDPDIVANWKPHLSSFGPILEQLPTEFPLLRNTTRTSQKKGKRKKMGKAEGEENANRVAQIRKKKDVFLPCHYFDYIGGTSTGGFVCFPHTLSPSFYPSLLGGSGVSPGLCRNLGLIRRVTD